MIRIYRSNGPIGSGLQDAGHKGARTGHGGFSLCLSWIQWEWKALHWMKFHFIY